MPSQDRAPHESHGESKSFDELHRLEEEQSQEARVRTLLAEGIPTLPAYVFELTTLLNTAPVDLRSVCRVIRTDPSLAAQVIRLCNSALLAAREKVSSIEDAVILLGRERLRTLVLTCSLVEGVGQSLSPTGLQSFWQHSLLAATLSERSALCLHYPRPERAYLAGLLHDVGALPLLLRAISSQEINFTAGPVIWGESVELERKHFGVDHCLIGKFIGTSWNFSAEVIDVLEHHHRPQDARHDALLVETVATADLICKMHGVRVGGEPFRVELADQNKYKNLIERCAPSLTGRETRELAKTLEVEFPDIIKLIELQVSGIQAGGVRPWPDLWR